MANARRKNSKRLKRYSSFYDKRNARSLDRSSTKSNIRKYRNKPIRSRNKNPYRRNTPGINQSHIDNSGNQSILGEFPQCCAGGGIYTWCCQNGIYKYRQETGSTLRDIGFKMKGDFAYSEMGVTHCFCHTTWSDTGGGSALPGCCPQSMSSH